MYRKIVDRMRERRRQQEFHNALRDASPAVRQELIAAAAHQQAYWLR